MVIALDSGSSCLGSSPGWGVCGVLGQYTLLSHVPLSTHKLLVPSQSVLGHIVGPKCQNELSVKAWEKAIQELGKVLANCQDNLAKIL